MYVLVSLSVFMAINVFFHNLYGCDYGNMSIEYYFKMKTDLNLNNLSFKYLYDIFYNGRRFFKIIPILPLLALTVVVSIKFHNNICLSVFLISYIYLLMSNPETI